jgi:Rhodopirellula transposase DDE domain/Transposase
MSSRRRWSYDEKLRLVWETLRSGETVAGVARRHEVRQQSLFNWRRKAREAALARTASADVTEILTKWQLMSPYLSRRQQSLWAAVEAAAIGLGGIKLVSGVTGISQPPIARGIRKLRSTKGSPAGSLILSGGESSSSGRPPNEVRDPQLKQALQEMLSDEVAGDPMSRQKWIRSSTRNLSRRLDEQGHKASPHTVARLLRKLGYSLRVNWRKKQAGAQHPDRDEQFKYIAALKAQYLGEGLPVISVDTKKKELIGNFKCEGKIWCRKPIETDPHYASYAKCVAIPFGIYDLAKNAGYVTVGISNNTSEFAVNCLESWWRLHGRSAYPQADRLLIFADGGGANGYNLRTWKNDLQDKLCDVFNLTITVSHYPPGCSKWNPVEYRLFSHISINWAGQPLRSLAVMLAFIRGTKTTTGLVVEAQLDEKIYRKGRKVSEGQFKGLGLSANDVCPLWNYTLSPRLNVTS